MQYHSGFAVWR